MNNYSSGGPGNDAGTPISPMNTAPRIAFPSNGPSAGSPWRSTSSYERVAIPPLAPPPSGLEAFKAAEGGPDGEGSPPKPTAATVARYTARMAEETVFNSKVSFPHNLTRMLECAESLGLSHIVRWSEDGRSFVICDTDAFLAEVMPRFFKYSENTKIRSFYRKLNRWNFSMCRKSMIDSKNVWHHPDFNRTVAVRALEDALNTGRAEDFLNVTVTGRKRRTIDNPAHPFDVDEDKAATKDCGSRKADKSSNKMQSRAASMPSLSAARASASSNNERKRWKMEHGLVSQPYHPTMLRQAQSMLSANATLDHRQGAFHAGSMSNATFDFGGRTGPSPNVFARSARDMLERRVFLGGTDVGLQAPARTSAGPLDLTQEEDRELADFFGNMARALEPQGEGEEECDGEPDPFPDDYGRASTK